MGSPQTADYIFYGSNIVTMDESCPSVTALATKDGQIIAVGEKEDVFTLGSEDTKYVALEGSQTLLPGLIEAHQHAANMIFHRCLFVNCSAYYYQSYKQIKDLIQKTVEGVTPSSGKWCIFEGWDPELVPDLPDLDMEMLDDLSQDIPILILGQNLHVAWANHKAFQLTGVNEDTKDPDGGSFVRDPDTKKLTGQMMEPVTYIMFLKRASNPSYDEYRKAIQDQWNQYANCGFTTVTELFFGSGYILQKALEDAALEPDFKLRLAIYKGVHPEDEVEPSEVSQITEETPSKKARICKENDKLWYAGVKIVSDGSPHCGTMACREPFLENTLTSKLGFPPSPNYGKLNFSDEQLYKMVKHWHDKGEQVAVHAHGERAIDQVLSVYEEVMTCPKDLDRRHRIEHLGLAEESHLIRASKLNLALSFFVSHLYFYAKTYTESIFGAARTNRWTPLSLANKHGLRWSLHQDNPAFPGPPEPFASIQTAVTRTSRGEPGTVYGEQYRVPTYDGLKAYTIDAAWQIHMEKELGSLTVGKRADLVILSENPLKVDLFKLVDIRVLDTYLDGRCSGLNERKESRKDGKLVYTYA